MCSSAHTRLCRQVEWLQDCGVTSVDDEPLIGFLTVLTNIGHYDFLINETLANELIQHLREFLRGESPDLLNDEGDPD